MKEEVAGLAVLLLALFYYIYISLFLFEFVSNIFWKVVSTYVVVWGDKGGMKKLRLYVAVD